MSTPEIQRTSLTATVLLLKSMGINDPLAFDFLDKPAPRLLEEALFQLFILSAIDLQGLITPLGQSY